MKPRILWVDDEKSLIESMKRQLHADFDITAAYSGDEALKVIGKNEPFGVIVSDQKMPGMDGIEFLSIVKDIAPDTTRIMLTGYAEQETAIEAVNQGQIFRFLTKPCPPHQILRTLRDAVRQYELVTAERDLLEKTLTGSIQVLIDVLALAKPRAFHRAVRIGETVSKVSHAIGLHNVWQVKSAAMLTHMGYITLPDQVLDNYYAGRHLTDVEATMMRSQTESTTKLLEKIPRMEPVIKIIHQYPTSRNTVPVQNGDPLLLSANILHAVIELDRMTSCGISRNEALGFLAGKSDEFNADVVAALKTIKLEMEEGLRRVVMVDQLANGMIIDEDIVTKDGMLLVPKGYVVNDTVRQRLRNFRLRDEIDANVAVIAEK